MCRIQYLMKNVSADNKFTLGVITCPVVQFIQNVFSKLGVKHIFKNLRKQNDL